MVKRPPDPTPAQPIEPELPPIPPDDLRVFCHPPTVDAAELMLRAAESGHVHAAALIGCGPHGVIFRLHTADSVTDVFALLALMDTLRAKLLASIEA